jgi:hypothetical protein
MNRIQDHVERAPKAISGNGARTTDAELEHKTRSSALGICDKAREWIRNETPSGARPVAIRRMKHPDMGLRIGGKYIFATDATAVSYSQSTVRARVRNYRVSEISVASVPNALAEPLPGRDPQLEQSPVPAPPGDPSNQRSRWSAKSYTGDVQPRSREEHMAFLLAAFEPGDLFDFSNPDDPAEFEKLYFERGAQCARKRS